jgi:mannan endo-1,4-beta-mannosidase
MMIKKITILALIFSHLNSFSQTTLKVMGRNLTLTTGQTVVLRGVNYPIINEGSISLNNPAQYQAYIDQVAQTGANAIRIPWYTSGKSWRDQPANGGTIGTVNSYVSGGHLNNIIAYCITKGMIPILSIHDDNYITCNADWNYFNSTVMNFWTSPAVLSLIENNKAKMIINLANEFDYVRWTGNQTTALNNFKANYNAAITTLRNVGVTVPIMIDAPDCGQSSTELLSIAANMNTNDPQHNLIFSSHAYWGGYASTLAQVQTKLNEAQNANVCFVLGEIANNQDDASCGDLGLYTLYPQILTEACSRNIGWLAWTFNHDCTQYSATHNNSTFRVMSTTSNINNLTPFGNDIVNNADYGLKAINGCGATNLLSNSDFAINSLYINIYPNPSHNIFHIKTPQKITKIAAFNELGKQTALNFVSEGQYIIKQRGVYLLKIELENGSIINKKIIIE